jgi:hypothetical protein
MQLMLSDISRVATLRYISEVELNAGASGIGIATAAGKAAFWDVVGAPESPKVIALENEFALTEGHTQELKT